MNKQLFKKSNNKHTLNNIKLEILILIQKFQIIQVDYQNKKFLHKLHFKCQNKLPLNKVQVLKIIFYLINLQNHNPILINLNNQNNNNNNLL